PNVAEHGRGCIGRGRPDSSEWRGITRSGPSVDRRRMVPEVGRNEFVVLCVHKNAVGMPQAGMGTLQNANGSYVAIVAGAEDEDFIRHRVGNKHFSMLDIQRNVCWPVQSCERALDTSQGWSVR